MQCLVVWAAIGLAWLPATAAETETSSLPVLIGTYTSGTNRGFYAADFDPATGRLNEPTLAAESRNPAFLAAAPGGRFIYAVSETASPDGRSGGAVAAFARDPQTGKFTFLNRQPSGGAGPCHVAVDRTGRCALVANYGSGSVAALPVRADGGLDAPASVIQHTGSSVNPSRQSGPHAHQVVLDPSNRFALVCDLGLDQVRVYRFDASKAGLTPNSPPFASVAPGSGPRHLAFHPNGRWVFVLNEMAATITVFRWNGVLGTLADVGTVATLPKDFSGADTAAEIVVHPEGRFLFASNRGHDSVAVLAVDDATGRLTPRQHLSAGGKMPRFIGVDPSGRWLLAANQASDSVVVFPFDSTAGRLGDPVQTLHAPTPVCLLFPTAPAAGTGR